MAPERGAIRRLAQDMPGLWDASETIAQNWQEIVRLLLEQVTVSIPQTLIVTAISC